MNPKLLIGMATFDDHRGVMHSIQSLRLAHTEAMPDVELAVVDNNSASISGQITREFCKKAAGGMTRIHYIPFTEATGTAAPRNRLFSVGTAPYVMCVDPHVQLYPGAIRRLIEFFEGNPETQDLCHGPLTHDNLVTFNTHFDDVWGDDQMWGVWANLWQCSCRRLVATPRKVDGKMELWDTRTPYVRCLTCGAVVPDCIWEGHERQLWDAGFRPLGADLNEPPFEIQAQGLGLFACRRDAWLGFHERFRGFGGEEHYIHAKFRKAGRKVLCLPFLRWWHEFRDPRERTPYRLDLWDKARNYVLGLTELGIPLDRARASFVDSGRIKAEDWDKLVADPDYRPQAPGCVTSPKLRTLDELFEHVKKTPRDLNEHADYIRDLASKHERVTAFAKRCEWNVILAAGRPRLLTVYQSEKATILGEIYAAVLAEKGSGRDYVTPQGGCSLDTDIEPTDLLVLDTVHSAERLTAELARHAGKVSRRILIRGAGAFGENAEGGGPGLFYALRGFLEQNPQWFVLHYTPKQYGLIVLSRVAEERPQPPISPWPIGRGPGTELKRLIASLGITPSPSCDCNAKAEWMDRIGVEGCKEHRDQIAKDLSDNAPRWGWAAKVKAAALAVVTGVAFKLDITDPFGSLVDLAIKKAEEGENSAHLAQGA